jgi:excinuclease ABC subunit A
LGERPNRLKLGGRTFCEIFSGSIQQLCLWNASLQDEIALHAQQGYLKKLSKSMEDLAGCLLSFGLGYLELSRDLSKISAGERSRLHLAREVSDGLSGVLFCIDEPSAGLHPLDCEQMLVGMKKLLARGSTLLVIEHDPLIISGADHLIRLGPGSGPQGGEVVYEGVPQGAPRGKRALESAASASASGRSACELAIEGANKNNLRNLSVKVPLGQLVCVCGVSGSGKSSLIIECLYPVLRRLLAKEIAQSRTLEHAEQNEFGVKAVSGSEFLSRVALPGVRGTIRSGRSTSATLSGILGELRQLYASTLDARVHGFGPNSFSFNSEHGWCPSCRGLGEVYPRGLCSRASCYPCEVCGGKRYAPKILSVKYKGFSIADTLRSSVDELCLRFRPIPGLFRRLSLMQEIGLGYLHMDQPVGGLSRGERQRLALVSDLCRLNSWDRVLFLLDEPTSGLGENEVMQLQCLFKRVVGAGASMVVIEHNTQFLSHADYLIELGPGPGAEGGSLLAAGPPAEIASCATSLIRRFLGTALI